MESEIRPNESSKLEGSWFVVRNSYVDGTIATPASASNMERVVLIRAMSFEHGQQRRAEREVEDTAETALLNLSVYGICDVFRLNVSHLGDKIEV